MNLDLWNQKKEKIGTIAVAEGIFADAHRMEVVYEGVKSQLANARRGTASTKTRAEVRGGGAKPWRQKGTGRARHGSIRSPLWRGGGVVFGPHPRDYSYSLPKKARRLALRVALANRFKENALWVVDKVEIDPPKTQQAAEWFARFGVDKALIILGDKSESVERSIRNLKDFKVIQAEQLNLLDVVRFPQILVTESGLRKIEQRLVS